MNSHLKSYIIKIMNRKATFVLFSITLLGIAVFYYIDTIFLPIQFKQYLTVKAEKYLQRKVYIGNVDFKLLKGFVIDDIGVARRDDPARAFIKIKQLSFNLMLAPVFRRQAVIIPAIRIFTSSVRTAGHGIFPTS